MYNRYRVGAYALLTEVLPFRLGPNVTPMTIAKDAKCMKFMCHTACQTLLTSIWKQDMALNTKWLLFPLFMIFPINLFTIHFKLDNLSLYKKFGSKSKKQIVQKPEKKTNESKHILYKNKASQIV